MFPSWNDVFVPIEIVNSIKTLPACFLLESLIHQLVFRKKRRPLYTYTCQYCTHKWKPERYTEEVTCCPQCNAYLITCNTKLRFSAPIPKYNSRLSLLDEIIDQVPLLFRFYFDRDVNENEKLIDVGWENDKVYAQFLGGEKVYEFSPKLCLIKAIILSPYLWDNGFSWDALESTSKNDKITVEHISPFLYNYCGKMNINPWIDSTPFN